MDRDKRVGGFIMKDWRLALGMFEWRGAQDTTKLEFCR